MISFRKTFLLAAAFVGILAIPAFADNLKGIDSSSGDLPIGAGGSVVLYVKTDGSVLLSSTNAATISKLDVAGGVRVGQDPNHSSSNLTGSCATADNHLQGVLSFAGGRLYLCDGTSWTKVSLVY